MNSRPITQEERDFVAANYATMSNVDLARNLKRGIETTKNIVLELAAAGRLTLKRPGAWGRHGAALVEVKVDPATCKHRRLCGDSLILRELPDFYETHEKPGDGQEWQICTLCGDSQLLQVYPTYASMGGIPPALATVGRQMPTGEILRIKIGEDRPVQPMTTTVAQNGHATDERIKRITQEYTTSLRAAAMRIEELEKDLKIEGIKIGLLEHQLEQVKKTEVEMKRWRKRAEKAEAKLEMIALREENRRLREELDRATSKSIEPAHELTEAA